ncbi:hypothetical protein PCASD_18811 [Puccinia coronata f. sp. avenae]|uniref:Uncharacterized protein n=1 Tax=Puccinia coronata f. sp. avenae TaxID=200324 RepID=A0A2N5T9J2_9BASI|nr:hypothetical protein PCASD_18811 [Puccinia coronata f. sp. avenae]
MDPLWDLVRDAYFDLHEKYRLNGTWRPSSPIVLIDKDRASWDEALSRLALNILPPMYQQLEALPELLDSPKLSDSPVAKHELFAEIQSQLEKGLDSLTSIVASFRSPPSSSSVRTDDHHSIEIKGFQCQEVKSRIESLIFKICHTCCIFSILIKTRNDCNYPASTFVDIESAIQAVANACESIHQLIKWITSHEISNILNAWDIQSGEFNKLLFKLTQLIHPISESKEENGESMTSPVKQLSNPEAVELAKSVMPILKLSRLFFKKSATILFNRTPSQLVTNMNSHQLDASVKLAYLTIVDLRSIIAILRQTDNTADTSVIAGDITRSIKLMKDRLDDILLLIPLYIIPLLPDLDHPSSPHHPLTWLANWHILFLSTTQKCMCAAETFEHSQPPGEPNQPIVARW